MNTASGELALRLTCTVAAMLLLAGAFPLSMWEQRVSRRFLGRTLGGEAFGNPTEFLGWLALAVPGALVAVFVMFTLSGPQPTDALEAALLVVYGVAVALLSTGFFFFRRTLAEWATRRGATERTPASHWRSLHRALYSALAAVGVFVGCFVALRSLGVL